MNVLALPSTRRNASQRRRAPQIIDAAARVFAERGFHGATTQDIADVLGIRQASLYYYFSSKEAALELVCLRGVEGFFEAAKMIAARPERARKRLISLIESHTKEFEGGRITTIKEKVGNKVSFGEIRLVLAWVAFKKSSSPGNDPQ